MGSDTTLPVSQSTKRILKDEKRDGETWDATLLRLAEGEPADSEVLDRLRRLEEQVELAPERTADELETRLR